MRREPQTDGSERNVNNGGEQMRRRRVQSLPMQKSPSWAGERPHCLPFSGHPAGARASMGRACTRAQMPEERLIVHQVQDEQGRWRGRRRGRSGGLFLDCWWLQDQPAV